MEKVQKVVITAAGIAPRHYPASATIQKEMFPLVDRDGTTRPTIQIILEEAVGSGIEEICLVTSPSSMEQYRNHFRSLPEELASYFQAKGWALEESEKLHDLGRRITYVVQEKQEGYGHAVYCAREFVGDAPFLLLLGDHVSISTAQKSCSRQLIDVYSEYECAVSGVQRTPE